MTSAAFPRAPRTAHRAPWAALALLTTLAAPAAAQEPAESLAVRLARAESVATALDEAVQNLRAQVQELAQSRVGSRLRNRVELSGLVLANGFYNSAKVNNADVPQFAALLAPADTAGGLPLRHLAGHVRQSRIGITVSGARALGAGLSADLQLDFYGGGIAGTGGRTHPLPRIRTATVRLDWPHVGLLAGQESPLVAPLSPVSFAASGFPLFAGSGNLWLWIPQLRLTFETGSRFRMGLQGALLAPLSGDTVVTAVTLPPDRAEKSGRPTAQGRVYVGWGNDDGESQIGAGIHRGWLAFGDSLLSSEAFTVDARLAFGSALLLQGEAFVNAQAVGGLGGGGIGQNVVAGRPVRTTGGWAQAVIRPSFAWELGGGYGMDDPNDLDVDQTVGRGKNTVMGGFLTWRPGGGLLLGVEARRIETLYPPAIGTLVVNHVNLYMGVAF